MVIIAPLFLISISYLLGVMLSGLLRDNDGRPTRVCLIGTFFVLILWEIFVHVGTSIANDFHFISLAFSLGLLLLLIISIVVNKKKIAAHFEVKNSVTLLPLVIIFLSLMASVICFLVLEADGSSDSSLETVNTVMTTNTCFKINPLTGQDYAAGELETADKLITLPYFYGYITELFGTDSETVVLGAMPVWVLVLTIFAYYVWADAFFEEENKIRRTMFFVCGIIVLNLMGTFSTNSTFYYQTLKGFSGETFCYSVLIPFAVYECFYGITKRKWQSGIYLLMAFACTLIVTKIQTGMVPFAIALSLAFLVSLGLRVRRRMGW